MIYGGYDVGYTTGIACGRAKLARECNSKGACLVGAKKVDGPIAV